VPAPIGPLHKFSPAGPSPSTHDVSSAPAGPSVTVPGAPLLPSEDADDPPTPAFYIPPALRVSRTPTAPRAATRTTSPTPRMAQELSGTLGSVLHVPPALRAGSTSSVPSAGSLPPPSAPHEPLPGFPPLHPDRDFTYHYTRRPRPPPAAPSPAASTAPAPDTLAASSTPAPAAVLPKGAVAVPPVVNQHAMGTRSKSGYQMPAAYHVAPLSSAEDLS
jgi:hypothetical protein